ncbi:hypothetical protein I33_2117 [Bacillus subtilis subsp. subtilis str. RO-NN-1]|nr:hypothetical protein I33_2117 [Bacillus subtilis subsp. subtilis str. RO-NN-1]
MHKTIISLSFLDIIELKADSIQHTQTAFDTSLQVIAVHSIQYK